MSKKSRAVKELFRLVETIDDVRGGFSEYAPVTRMEEREGLGQVTVLGYYPEEEAPLPERPPPGPPTPGTEMGNLAERWNKYAVQRILGEMPRRDFSHLPQTKLTRLSLWSYFVIGIAANIIATIRYQFGRKA